MKFPIEMYRIRKEDMKIKVPCERCLEKGIVNKYCHRCGGNGTHNKTIKVWKVAPRTVTVEKIDRASKDSYYKGVQTSYVGGLRYWTGASEFFNEEDKYLHFNKNDAQEECDKRNMDIADILKIHKQEKQKMIKYFCDRVGCGKEITDKATLIPIYAYDGKGIKIIQFGYKHICEDCAKKLEEIKTTLLSNHYEQDFLQMTDEDIELLHNTFKIGDKVITADGRTGTITDICTCDRCKERGFYEPTVDFGDYTDYIMTSDKNDDFKSYYKIGDRVFGNINEESVNKELEEIGERYNKLVKQQSIINLLKAQKENNNGN